MAPPTASRNHEAPDEGHQMSNPSQIRNKFKRAQVMVQFRKRKREEKKEAQKQRREALVRAQDEDPESLEPGATDSPTPASIPQALVPRTLESTREVEVTAVTAADAEIAADEADDEFARVFDSSETPKIMLTTRPQPSGELFHFLREWMDMLPNAFYYPRGSYDIKDICVYAANKKFTHLMVLSEQHKVCNGMLMTKLPLGPSCFFKVSNVTVSAKIASHGRKTSHLPEVLLNNFSTRLGHRIGRMLGSVFPHVPEFQGRQVVTFHNQRDYIFVRHHRYVFTKEGTRARLQELGPKFTLRLRWLQEGTFDSKFGDYEWIHKRKEMDTTRRRFHL